MQQVERFHEKHPTAKGNKKARVNELKAQFWKKRRKKVNKR